MKVVLLSRILVKRNGLSLSVSSPLFLFAFVRVSVPRHVKTSKSRSLALYLSHFLFSLFIGPLRLGLTFIYQSRGLYALFFVLKKTTFLDSRSHI